MATLGTFNAFDDRWRDALWPVESPAPLEPDLFTQDQTTTTTASLLMPMDLGEQLQADFDGQNLRKRPHATVLLCTHLPPEVWRAVDWVHAENAQRVLIAGNVICRQRPGMAKGFVFVGLENETGVAHVIVPPKLSERQRLALFQEAFLLHKDDANERLSIICGPGKNWSKHRAVSFLDFFGMQVDWTTPERASGTNAPPTCALC